MDKENKVQSSTTGLKGQVLSTNMIRKSIDLSSTSTVTKKSQNAGQTTSNIYGSSSSGVGQRISPRGSKQNGEVVLVSQHSNTSNVSTTSEKSQNYLRSDQEAPSPVTAGALQKLFLEQKQMSSSNGKTPSQGYMPMTREGDNSNTSQYNQQIQGNFGDTVVDEVGASRRFSMFSKSSFATSSSFMFGTRLLNRSSHSGIMTKSTPKVSVATIFKNKAYLYLDEALISTFDDLLDKGHEIVTQRKDEKDILAAHEAAMKAEILQEEKEITPLIQRSNFCIEQIVAAQATEKVYERELAALFREGDALRQAIYQREEEVQSAHNDLTENIKQMEIHNNEIRADININKACHRQEANQQTINKKQKQTELDGLSNYLVSLKAEYEQKRMGQADRLRKMENKQKMYMGILKH